MPKLRNILVANRGEIALRIERTARALGYRTTAIYSEADAHAPHVTAADAAVLVGPAAVAQSYLNVERILDAARRSGADAVHPGYGLLSENAAFARACIDAGLVFIGPSPETIAMMGDKRAARRAMQAAGIACVPGYDGEDQSDPVLVQAAAGIGFPIMVKAAAGGGGRGMRRVESASELPEAIARARSEASKAFGDDRLILERAIEAARHVEVQIAGDRFGDVIHLGERECSVQRRFQKIIEEAPSPAVDSAMRERLGELSVRAAKSAGYVGIGTVEMLLDAQGAFYFLEMNTRIQVEHAVTELVTGLDLVALQFAMAEGEPLPRTQAEVQFSGHAIEARLYAEDPARGFLPSSGRIAHVEVARGEGVRVDHALRAGLSVSTHYDPMLAKVIACGADREQARRRLLRALEHTHLFGVRTNQRYVRELLEHDAFVTASATTEFVERQPMRKPEVLSFEDWRTAAAIFTLRGSVDSELSNFSNCAGFSWPLRLVCDEQSADLRVEPTRDPGQLILHYGAERVELRCTRAGDHAAVLVVGGVRTKVAHAWDGEQLWLETSLGARAFLDTTHAPRASALAHGSGRALAPMDGVVVEVPVRPGERVARGQTLAVVEAMKLELRVPADIDGVVRAVHVARGHQVKARQVLVEVGAE